MHARRTVETTPRSRGRSPHACKCADTLGPGPVRLVSAGRIAPDALREARIDIMEKTKLSERFGLFDSGPWSALNDGVIPPKRVKRNPWIVVSFFALVIVAWINSQM